MSSAWILTVALVGPPPELADSAGLPAAAVTSAAIDAAERKTPRSPKAIRDAYRLALRSASKKANAKPEDVVPALTAIYTELGSAKGFAHSEKARMRGVVKVRLEKLQNELSRDNIRRKQEFAKDRRRLARLTGGRNTGQLNTGQLNGGQLNGGQLNGGGEIARAAELIELIHTTISPSSWDVNGGNGRIRYFPLLKVLVVRATGEVHHQIGGVLPQLRAGQ